MNPHQIMRRGKPCWTVDLRSEGKGRLFAKDKPTLMQKFCEALAGTDKVEFTEQDRQAKIELGERGTLLQAVRSFLSVAPAKTEKPIGEAIKECVERKKALNRRSAYTKHLETILSQFEMYVGNRYVGSETLVSAITSKDVEDFLNSRTWAITTRQPMRKRLSAFFSFCMNASRGYCLKNPAAMDDKDADRERVVRPVPRIFTPSEAEALLRTAQEKFPKLLPYLVLGIFTGIRPDELAWLKPSNIHLDRANVEVPAEVSKTHQRRFVDLSDNAMEWLRVAPSLEVSMKRYWHKRLVKAAGVKWSSDVMRHSFASYHIERDKSADKTALQLGHQGSTATLFAHYKQTVTSEAAKEFWSLLPKPLVSVLEKEA